MHFPQSFPGNAFVVALLLTLKAGGDEAELREEQDMVKDSAMGAISSLMGHVSIRSRDLSPRSSIRLAKSKFL